MKCPKLRLQILLLASALVLVASSARAELWSALDTKPKPNLIIGYDTSVTMRIDTGCNSCHRRGLSPSQERSFVAKQQLLATMPLFQDYFVYGGFEYQGCGSASVRTRVDPNIADPVASYNQTVSLLNNISPCNSSENRLPGGTTINCLMPGGGHLGCNNDPPTLRRIIEGGIPGLSLPLPASGLAHTSTVCGSPTRLAPTLDVTAAVAGYGASFSWPRWDALVAGGRLDAATVRTELCDRLYTTVLAPMWNDLNRCLVDPHAYWDLSGASNIASWCDANTIAASACRGGSVINSSCVCNDTQRGCGSTTARLSPCNVPYDWKARQQRAVCETYNPNLSGLGWALAAQPDNIASGGCRENVAMFFTDGYQGHRTGVSAEAAGARPLYTSVSGQPNMFVFRISNSFRGEADSMMRYVTNGQINNAFVATDGDRMRTSFSQVLARVFKGDYGGSPPTFSPTGDGMVMSSFMVPGYEAGAPVSDTYIGWPNHIAWYRVDQNTGLVDATAPLFRTDEDALAGQQAGGCYTQLNVGNRDLYGPGRRFNRGNGDRREVRVSTGSLGDRDGDGTPEPPVDLRFGYFYGFGATRPVVVEGPNEVPNPAWGLEWGNHVTSHAGRPRVVYSMGGGYVLGFHAGDFNGSGNVFGTYTNYTYDMSAPNVGREVLRYQPSWMQPGDQAAWNPRYQAANNDVVPQRLTTGSLVVREVYIDDGVSAPRFATVLVGAQGKEGAGYFVLDVSDPCSPGSPIEWKLPRGAYASARPEVYYMRSSRSGSQYERAVVVTTGGLGGRAEMYAYDVATGNQVAMVSLPSTGNPNDSYPSAPVCVDVTGEGAVTHCYVLRSDGYLFRVPVGIDAFGSPDDITPRNGGSPITVGGGRYFSTEPVAFFGTDGAVHLVFGSGDHRNLTSSGGTVRNQVYKVVDSQSLHRPNVVGGRASVSGVCIDDGSGNVDGVFDLAPGERLISPPMVSDGVVAWSTYHASSTGCIVGSGSLYAMRFDTCEEALETNGANAFPPPTRPSGHSLGNGIPMSPAIHGPTGRLYGRTSNDVRADALDIERAVTTSNGRPWARKLYWRYEIDVR